MLQEAQQKHCRPDELTTLIKVVRRREVRPAMEKNQLQLLLQQNKPLVIVTTRPLLSPQQSEVKLLWTLTQFFLRS